MTRTKIGPREAAPPPGVETDPLLTTKEVAKLLRRPEGTLRQWRHRGLGPEGFRCEGGLVLYRLSKVNHWLVEQEQRGGGEAA